MASLGHNKLRNSQMIRHEDRSLYYQLVMINGIHFPYFTKMIQMACAMRRLNNIERRWRIYAPMK